MLDKQVPTKENTSGNRLIDKRNGYLHDESKPVTSYHWDIVWRNVISITLIHVLGIYGFYLKCCFIPKWQSLLFNAFNLIFHGIGVTAGRHRLWSHGSYKAHFLVEIFLTIMAASVYEQSIYIWVRDHRLHHKHSDTDADPYNSSRGFFFCHIGWFFLRKHQQVLTKGKTIDMSDLQANQIVMFEHKYNKLLSLIFTLIIPTVVPWYFWGEKWEVALFYCCIWRLILVLNITWSINSVAHLYGYRPYDTTIQPVENNLFAMASGGEGFHNYHHAFPWDYKTAELGSDMRNFTTVFLDFLATYGLVYDRKTANEEMIKQRVSRTGDADLLQGKKNLKNVLLLLSFLIIFT